MWLTDTQLDWLRCVRDHSDHLGRLGGYVTAGPKLLSSDRHLRNLGLVSGPPEFPLGSMITEAGLMLLLQIERESNDPGELHAHLVASRDRAIHKVAG